MSFELTGDTREYIENMGLVFERFGTSRTVGKLIGLLLIAEEPQSLDDIADLLQVSKASASTNGRLCEQLGLLRRVGKPGHRQTYYELAPNAFERTLAVKLKSFDDMIEIARHGMLALDESSRAGRARLSMMIEFYGFLGAEIKNMLERWSDMRRSR
jgi:DNA-binding transcriptional regulator GbsR (MarR family)